MKSEIISTPKQPKDFIIREELHPLKQSKIFRVYDSEGPLYISGETVKEAEMILRKSELVRSIELSA